MQPRVTHEKDNLTTYQTVGLIILSIRFVQGFIFWGGGSRRFIYAPQKLDPHAAQWMANKLQAAMPGAIFGMGEAISYLLQHFVLLYSVIIAYSLVELLSGLALIIGCFTRTAALITAFLSITTLLIFGWEGATCLDEWTMAVANLAIGLTLALSGAAIYSVDGFLLRRYPSLLQRPWFLVSASGPWSSRQVKWFAIISLIFTVLFTLSTYNYYRGAIFSKFHVGPVSPSKHHITLSEGALYANGAVTFTAYVDAGTTALPSNIIRVDLENNAGKVIESWDGATLSILSPTNIINQYAYNRFTITANGISAPVSAKAAIHLPQVTPNIVIVPGNYRLQIYTIDGHRFDLDMKKT